MINVIYLSWLPSRIGKSEELVEKTESLNSVQDLINSLLKKGEGYETVFSQMEFLKVAVNQQLIEDFSHVITDNDRVTFFSPLAGG